MLSVCKVDRFDKQAWHSRVVQGVDLSKLDQILDGIDYSEVRKRKLIYSRLFHEASIAHEHGLGISFTDMLTLLAHHKLIVDAEALVYVLLVVLSPLSSSDLSIQTARPGHTNGDQQTCYGSGQSRSG